MGFRVDVRAAIVSVARTYQDANPTLLRKVYPARPANFAETPAAYVHMSETVSFSGDIQDRLLRPSLIVVGAATDNEEATAAMDVLADALLLAFAAVPHAVSGSTLLEPTGVEDIEDQVGTVSYPGFSISFQALEPTGR